jgi:two-component system response regulator FlrC
MSKSRLLIAEDDWDLREALVDTLSYAGFEVLAAESAEQALDTLATEAVDMVISDVNMAGMDGHELLQHIRAGFPLVPVLLITAYGSISQSVEAMRAGAVDYLVKPFKPETLVETVCRYVAVSLDDGGSDSQPVAEEVSSRQLLRLARKVAVSDATVLISGESGTGKEVLARFIHRQSRRANKVFIAINCAAIPENMLEATLFGHEKGAFTGAYTSSPGKFEQADGGTILLDEISEMDIGLQAKILRVLQEREVERVGGRKTIPLDVRIIATTNRDLQSCVADGSFREDLYYRLSVFPLQWLPLRERQQDILPLAERLLQRHAEKMARMSVNFDESARRVITRYAWPGNVRELDNVIQRALILQDGGRITAACLGLDQRGPGACSSVAGTQMITVNGPVDRDPGRDAVNQELDDNASALGSDLKRREFEIILKTLREQGGRRKETAEVLGVSARTLRYKLARMRDSGINIESLVSA